jgi:hypothetical protein
MPCRLAWCPLCYSTLRGRKAYRGHRGYREARVVWEERPMSVLRSRSTLPQRGSGGTATVADDWSLKYPGIWEMLTGPTMPDGSARKGGSLFLFAQDGLIKCCLTDRDLDEQAWASGDGVISTLDAMERGLQGGTLEWRKPKPYSKRGGR